MNNPFKLSFEDKAFEKKFRRSYDYENRAFIRLGCILSIAVCLLIDASAVYYLPDIAADIIFVSSLTVFPVMAAGIAFTFFKRAAGSYQYIAAAGNTITAFLLMFVSFNY